MKLSEWLKSRNMKQTELARKLGISSSMVSKLSRGKRVPSLELIQEIHRQTGGRVGLKDWSRVDVDS